MPNYSFTIFFLIQVLDFYDFNGKQEKASRVS